MKFRKPVASKGTRVFFGLISLAFLYFLFDGLVSGQFLEQGAPVTRVEQPIRYYATALVVLIIATLMAATAIFARERKSDK